MPNLVDRWFRRGASSKGAQLPPSIPPAAVVYHDSVPTSMNVGPGGGWGWGAGPRFFVGPSRPPDTNVEIGREGDFVDGQPTWGPNEGDLGFPHSTRWPGYPGQWEQPFYQAPPYGGFPFGGPSLQPPGGLMTGGGWGDRFMGGGGLLEGRISVVFSCVDLISRLLATMDLSVTMDSEPIVGPPWTDNPEPKIYTSMVDAIKQIVNCQLIRGEAFVIPTARYADGMVARWVVLNPDMVNVEANGGGTLDYTVADIPIPASEILHMRYQSWPGIPRGVGPLEACWRNIMSATALENYGLQLAASGGIPTAVLQSQVKLTKPQAEDLKRSWAEASISRGVIPAVLSGGLTYTPLNLKPSELGLLDLRRFDEQRIASTFGIPLWLVGLPMQDGLTYSTVEGTFDYLWRANLRAMAYNISSALSGWALPRGQWLRFDSEALIRPPINQRATAYKTLIDAGVISPDEARVFENLRPGGPETTELLAKTTDGGI